MDDDLIGSFKALLWPPKLAELAAILEAHPELVNSRPWAPGWDGTAIEAMASGSVWHRPKHTQAARLLLDAGAVCSFQVAARAGLLDEVQRQLAADPSLLDSVDAKGATALYRAACVYGVFTEGEAVADALIAAGATIDLHTATALGMVDVVKEVLRIDPEAASRLDPAGMTALHWSARTRRHKQNALAITILLLDAGADITARNPTEEGMMAIHHLGEWCGQTDQVDLLLARSADINAAADNGWTPLDYALDRGRHEMAAHLIAHGGSESGKRGG